MDELEPRHQNSKPPIRLIDQIGGLFLL